MEAVRKTFIKDGVRYKIRFFDFADFDDLQGLKETINSPGVRRWMESVSNFNHVHYQSWMSEQGRGNKFLFAIVGPGEKRWESHRICGFVYVYPSELVWRTLEISYAKRPGAPSGLIAPAAKRACKYVRAIINEKRGHKLPAIKIIAEIEKGNDPSIRVVEKVGFEMTRDFDRTGNAIWTLNWRKAK